MRDLLYRRYARFVTQEICEICYTGDMRDLLYRRYARFAIQEICEICYTGDMRDLLYRRYARFVIQEIYEICYTGDMRDLLYRRYGSFFFSPHAWVPNLAPRREHCIMFLPYEWHFTSKGRFHLLRSKSKRSENIAIIDKKPETLVTIFTLVRIGMSKH
jgi:hypothetical protein